MGLSARRKLEIVGGSIVALIIFSTLAGCISTFDNSMDNVQENPDNGADSIESVARSCLIPFWVPWVKNADPLIGAGILFALVLLFGYFNAEEFL
jgi:hypothetical protein